MNDSTQTTSETTEENLIDTLIEQIRAGEAAALRRRLATLHEAEIADALEAMPGAERRFLWAQVPEHLQADVLSWVDDGVRVALLEGLGEAEAVAAVADMDTPDLAEVVDSVSDELADAIISSLDWDERLLVEERLRYPEDSAGRLMEREWVAVRADVTLEVVSRYLKWRGDLPAHTDGLMVVDREGIYVGKLPVSTLLTRDEELQVGDVMEPDADWVLARVDQREVAGLFERRDLVSVAVVGADHRLIGRITVDDVIDIIREEAEHQFMHMAGLEEGEDLFAPILASARRRLFWLAVNLATAFLAAWVIGLFEATLDKIVALAVLMPIVASMGGIAGSQTLTLAIRGLALGQISSTNTRWLAIKEIAIAAINGLVWALVVGLIAWGWFGDLRIGLVLGGAMVVNLFAAAAAGLAVPLLLERVGIDPALSGSVILTTVTDVVGFMSFLGLATLFLL
jgi:magnesium transporter